MAQNNEMINFIIMYPTLTSICTLPYRRVGRVQRKHLLAEDAMGGEKGFNSRVRILVRPSEDAAPR